ncbi:flagellar basal body-associated FliL family protein [Sphingomonas sp. PAMC 26621]|uniref:flagellar basal body-associated FliL family protein n=1 Tax=Sphingomonas sp. PAMC 26621 TaxID=1112213 RepID=UPI00028A0B57|nr:flagellar basal body-associated FliL family protein [Sphingomonas sp. PAMC 26621]
MSKADKDSGAGAAGEGGEAPAPAPNKKKKLMLFGAIGAVLLLGGGGGAYMLLGSSGKTPAQEEAAAEASAKEGGGAGEKGGEKEGEKGKEAAHFVDVPAMVVNLRSADGASRFLKLHFVLVPGDKGNPEAITAKLPLLLDAYQPFLRELRPDDLAGSAAVYRVKEEMLVRAHQTLGDGAVKDVLIQDLIQQ